MHNNWTLPKKQVLVETELTTIVNNITTLTLNEPQAVAGMSVCGAAPCRKPHGWRRQRPAGGRS